MIMVCDSIMGSGKSQSAIAYMNKYKDRKFIYITPFLDECERIRRDCPELNFVAPKANAITKGSKIEHTRQLLKAGENVATTHCAFRSYTDDMVEAIKNHKYTLIVDEAVDVLEGAKCKRGDVELLVKAGYLKKEGNIYVPTDEEYDGGYYTDLFRRFKSNELTWMPVGTKSNEYYYWLLPLDILNAFRDVIVLTYLFDASDLKYYFDICKIEFTRIGIQRDGDQFWFVDRPGYIPEYVTELKDKIHIVQTEKMLEQYYKKTALSQSWLSSHAEERERLKKNLYNFFNYQCRETPTKDKLWSTYKSAFDYLKGAGYHRRYLVFNSKATNAYRNCTCLAYCVNLFEHKRKINFFAQYGIKYDEDKAALSTMIQWIWRSAIRDGKPITIYIPSYRMRKLLLDWMDELLLVTPEEGGIPL